MERDGLEHDEEHEERGRQDHRIPQGLRQHRHTPSSEEDEGKLWGDPVTPDVDAGLLDRIVAVTGRTP